MLVKYVSKVKLKKDPFWAQIPRAMMGSKLGRNSQENFSTQARGVVYLGRAGQHRTCYQYPDLSKSNQFTPQVESGVRTADRA